MKYHNFPYVDADTDLCKVFYCLLHILDRQKVFADMSEWAGDLMGMETYCFTSTSSECDLKSVVKN